MSGIDQETKAKKISMDVPWNQVKAILIHNWWKNKMKTSEQATLKELQEHARLVRHVRKYVNDITSKPT